MAKRPERTEKAVRFIAKLVQLTQEGKIEWTYTSNTRLASGAAFETVIEGSRLRIYRYSEELPNSAYAAFANEQNGLTIGTINPLRSIVQLGGPIVPPKTIVQSGTVLEILTGENQALYKFEHVTGMNDLYESAAFSASNVNELMDAVLAKD